MRDLLPEYAAGSLPEADRERVRAHLGGCPRCRADLASWQAMAAPPAPQSPDPAARPHPAAPPDPAALVRAVLTRGALTPEPPGPPRRLRHLAALMAAEARLIRMAVPIASALVMALGVGLVLAQATVGADLVLALVAPIVAAAGVAGAYRSGRDPAAEVVAATPTSGRLLLLVRIALVFGYDLVLAVAASAALAATGAAGTAGLNTLVAAWLGPMVLLSSVSLLVAVRFGPDSALGAAVGLWAVRVLIGGVFVRDGWMARFVVEVWTTNASVLTAGAALTAAAFVVAGREPHGAGRATHRM
ncbi:hypothetical protein Aph02nite_94180 [Actinoplanes philippinensis]|uniref:Putative zinc-finger n=1 Tax=Actinoplanes philippinensis TaxID=35752 RepID=A0A1I2N9C8_9ACTN|nr:zf-HC2 domain-containing protein [Actinoplanes philippinensis]GIE83468.1 hypothetical protein Aph02nite_94180 [Actinoplanes philippinensis]SFF99720.1 Putative zinc-finger [Actinoplanes philippinensis]